jgi:hypothetical protein
VRSPGRCAPPPSRLPAGARIIRLLLEGDAAGRHLLCVFGRRRWRKRSGRRPCELQHTENG